MTSFRSHTPPEFMRIGLISTTNTNIGDDLIRTGIVGLLRTLLPESQEHIIVNKHQPLDVFSMGFIDDILRTAPAMIAGVIRPAVAMLAHRLRENVMSDCGLIVQCGTPVFWPGCHRAEWAVSIWKLTPGDARVTRQSTRTLLNLIESSLQLPT